MTTTFVLASCLESNELLIDEAKLADPFGHDFAMTYHNSEYLIPRGKWFDTMSSNGRVVQVGFVAPEFLRESARYSFWITVFRTAEHYSYALMRFNKDERSAYLCRPGKQAIDSQQALYKAMADEYRDIVKNGTQQKCGVPSFVREAPTVPVRTPLPDGPLTADDKIKFVQEMIETAKVGRKRDRNNVAYDFLSRNGVLQECQGPFIGRITSRPEAETAESAVSLVMVYMGEPSNIGEQEEAFKACTLGLRRMEYMLMENVAMSMGMVMPDGIKPSRLIAIDRNFLVFLDSE